MKKCENIEGKLTAYIDGRLSGEEKGFVEEHLRSCPDCARALDELKKTKALLESLDDVDPPGWLTAKIMSRISEEEEIKGGFFRKLFFPLHIKVPAEVLAAACVVVLSVLVYRATTPDMTSIRQVPSGIQISKQIPAGSTEKTSPYRGTPRAKTIVRDRGVVKKDGPPGEKAAIEKPKEIRHAPPPQKTFAAKNNTGPGLSNKESASAPAGLPETYAPENTAGEHRMKDELPVLRGKARPYPAAKMKAGRNPAAETMLKEEKAGRPPERATQPAAAVRPHYRISIISDTPSETARKVKEILRSLEGKEVKEKRQGETTVIYGWINTRNIGPLTDRLEKAVAIQEKSARADITADLTMMEIAITGTDKDRDETGTRIQY